jgi:aminoglycoside phosphotransferase family enzyme/predicted kinase
MPPTLIADLAETAAYPHPVGTVTLIQTHISWVFLAGDFAYKIKKPVDFGFLDFSTLAKRKALCEAEVQLNRRFAPELYLGVVPITRADGKAQVGGNGTPVEWAVQMLRFPQQAQLDRRLELGQLTAADLATFAAQLADVHGRLPRAAPESQFGSSSAVLQPVVENFEQIATTAIRDRCADVLARLEAWSHDEHALLAAQFDARKRTGYVRECHGDLHLSNLVQLDDRIAAFDCIEFNPGLRWIDVISDLAFLLMDLEIRARADLATTLLDRYLERTGDYTGARLLQYYRVYRSLVRAKVAALQHAGNGGDPDVLTHRFDEHVRYAAQSAFSTKPVLYLTCGLSGSGKSWLSERLVPLLPAIRIRSDVERKRLLDGTTPHYTAAAIGRVYEHLAAGAASVLAGGTSVIVDATFIAAAERNRFAELAERLALPWQIVYTTAARTVLESRVNERGARGDDPSDADLAVLARQLETFEPPAGAHVLCVDTGADVVPQAIAELLRARTSTSSSASSSASASTAALP